MPFITLLEPGAEPQTRELTQATVIGRGDDCDWVIPHRLLSRRHLVIRREGGAWQACDLGSTNGTFLEGQRISRHSLLEGDELNIGGLGLVFTVALDGARNDRSTAGVNAAAAEGDPMEAVASEPPADVQPETVRVGVEVRSDNSLSAPEVVRAGAGNSPAADPTPDEPPAPSWSLRREPDQRVSWEAILAPAQAGAEDLAVTLRERLESISSLWQGLEPKRRRQSLVASGTALLLVPLILFGTSSPRLPPAKVDPATLGHSAGPPQPTAAIEEQPV